jgi:hypothetical protein
MTSFIFRETLMTHLLLWGNAYAQIIRNGKGEVLGLYPLDAGKDDGRSGCQRCAVSIAISARMRTVQAWAKLKRCTSTLTMCCTFQALALMG